MARPNVYSDRSTPGRFSGIELDDTPAEHAPSPLKTIPVHELGAAGYSETPGDPLVAQRPEYAEERLAVTVAAGRGRVKH